MRGGDGEGEGGREAERQRRGGERERDRGRCGERERDRGRGGERERERGRDGERQRGREAEFQREKTYLIHADYLIVEESEIGYGLLDIMTSLNIESINDLCIYNSLHQRLLLYLLVSLSLIRFYQVDGTSQPRLLHTQL